MRFLRKNKSEKVVLVISDLHLGAGEYVEGKKNFLEDFHHDKELVEFLEYYSQGQYANVPVELIINGDFLDFLAVPFVPYFDDEFWSEKAAKDKLDMIHKAHPEVIEALGGFLKQKDKSIVYIIGNHDGEMVFESLRDRFKSFLPEACRERLKFYLGGEYIPVDGVVIKHGHEYEIAHQFDNYESIVEAKDGTKYFIPPWGSYYVMRVINKFKQERDFVNQVRPIKNFIINGLIFDTLFIMRFLFANAYYFIMVRFLQIYQNKLGLKEIFSRALKELELFQDFETLTANFFETHDVKALIVGHTHEPTFTTNASGNIFINTGTWTKMTHLDFSKNQPKISLTYAKVDVGKKEKEKSSKTELLSENEASQRKKEERRFDHLDITLNVWKGKRDLPFYEFN